MSNLQSTPTAHSPFIHQYLTNEEFPFPVKRLRNTKLKERLIQVIFHVADPLTFDLQKSKFGEVRQQFQFRKRTFFNGVKKCLQSYQ